MCIEMIDEEDWGKLKSLIDEKENVIKEWWGKNKNWRSVEERIEKRIRREV